MALFLRRVPLSVRAAVAALYLLDRRPGPLAPVEGALVACVAAGVAGRGCAVLLLVPAMLTEVGARPDLWFALVLLLVILGTGELSLWAPERKLFARDAG